MIVWGGTPDGNTALNTGGRYNPATDTWSATTTTNAPSARSEFNAVWTGTGMIVWGGTPDYTTALNTGGRYTPRKGLFGRGVIYYAPTLIVFSFSFCLHTEGMRCWGY